MAFLHLNVLDYLILIYFFVKCSYNISFNIINKLSHICSINSIYVIKIYFFSIKCRPTLFKISFSDNL